MAENAQALLQADPDCWLSESDAVIAHPYDVVVTGLDADIADDLTSLFGYYPDRSVVWAAMFSFLLLCSCGGCMTATQEIALRLRPFARLLAFDIILSYG